MKKICFISAATVLYLGSGFAASITTIEQLDQAAVMHFALMSDNKDAGPNTSLGDPSRSVGRFVDWIKAGNCEFVLGLGDNWGDNCGDGKWDSFVNTDSYFKYKFYPNVADGENQDFGSGEGDWGAGRKAFGRVNNFWGRSNVQKNPRNTQDSSGNVPDYYASFSKNGYTVHVISLTWSDTPNDSSAFKEESRAFMQDKLTDLAALKDSEPGKHIVMVLGHTYNGEFIANANLGNTRKQLLLTTADFIGCATIHRYGWFNRYKTDYQGKNGVVYNTGCCGNSGCNGYLEFHVLPNPTRLVIQYIYTERSTRQLHVGQYSDFPTTETDKFGTPIIKDIDGSWYEADWNNINLGTSGTNGASYVSQTVPTSIAAGQTASVTVRMKNTGTSTWSPAEAQKLGSLGDSNTWGLTRVYLTGSVAPGKTNAFTFNITAPATAGNYSFQWRMVDDEGSNVGWFGANSALQMINVTAGTMTTVPWVTNLTVAAAGTAITNAGLVVGSVSQEYHATVPAGKIFSQTPGGGTSVSRGSSVALAASLGPQPQLVLNNSFETNTASWTLSGTGVARSTTTHAGSGVASLRINMANSSATQRVAIVSGKTYDISTYVYVSARTAGMVVFDTWDKYDAAGQGQFTFSATNGGWKKYSGSFTATNTSLTVRMFSDSAFSGTAYFDLIELKPR